MPEKKPYNKPTVESVLNKPDKKIIPSLSLTLPIYARNAESLSQHIHALKQPELTNAWAKLPMKYKLLAGILQQHAENGTLYDIMMDNNLGQYQPGAPRESTIVEIMSALTRQPKPNAEALAAEIAASIPELVTPKSKSEIQSIIETDAGECIAEIKKTIENKRNELPPQIKNTVLFDAEICFLLGLPEDLAAGNKGLAKIIESIRLHEFAQNCPTLTDLKNCVSDLLTETFRGYPASPLAQQRKLVMDGWQTWKDDPKMAVSMLRTKFNTVTENSTLSSYQFGQKRELALILNDLDQHGRLDELFEFIEMPSSETVKPGVYKTICTDPLQSGAPSHYRVEVVRVSPGSELLDQIDPSTHVAFTEGELVVHIKVRNRPAVNTYKLTTLQDGDKLHFMPVSA